MLNRHKVLLALIAEFGGIIGQTDCQKLMFLLRQDYNQNYYDFFPYNFGAYSLVLARDKRYLTNLGYLKSRDHFAVNRSQRVSTLLHSTTNRSIRSLAKQVGNSRGNDLLKVTYKRFPYYASASQKAESILSKAEYAEIRKQDKKEATPCLFTLGYEGKSIDLYLDQLKKHNISTVIDVRNNPLSRKFGFSKKQLVKFVPLVGTEYVHLPELGIPANMRRNLDSDKAYSNLFKYYEAKILPQQTKSLTLIKDFLRRRKRVTLTCFEADYRSCHRSIIAEYLTKIDAISTPIKHL